MSIFNRFRRDEVQRYIKRLGSKRSDPDDVFTAMNALRDIGERAVQPLIQVLLNQDEDYIFRCRVADTFAEMKEDSAVEPLIATLSDGNEQIRWHSIKALEKLGDRRAIPELQRMAASDEGEFTITWSNHGDKMHFVLKDEARKVIEKIESTGKR